jgi:hypothetical protein
LALVKARSREWVVLTESEEDLLVLSGLSEARKTRSPASTCPFDPGYHPMLGALVFAVHDCGFQARCGSGPLRVTLVLLHIVGKGDPPMPALLVDRNRRGRKAGVRESPQRNGDLLVIPFFDV